jgi:aspartate/methionine/tyrosine aminotransferase
MERKLTELERERLSYKYNLCDAQPYFSLSKNQIENLLDVSFHITTHRLQNQQKLENLFLKKYSHLSNQTITKTPIVRSYITYSASICIEIVANYLRQENQQIVGFLDPSFDSIFHIFRRNGFDVIPFHEKLLLNVNKLDEFLKTIDVLVLVMPNNPTGLTLNESEFRNLCVKCKKNNVKLVADFCYRFFSKLLLSYDQYKIAAETQVDFYFIEDTGKLFPLLELKLGVLNISKNKQKKLSQIYLDFTLGPPRFNLIVLSNFLDYYRKGELAKVQSIISLNRQYLISKLGPFLSKYCTNENISVVLISFQKLKNEQIFQTLENNRIAILKANNFYKLSNTCAYKYRISLSRDFSYFKKAVDRIASILSAL